MLKRFGLSFIFTYALIHSFEGVGKMKFEMQKATMLAENITSFIRFVEAHYENKKAFYGQPDKWFQVKLFIEEFKFHIVASELLRINRFTWDEKYTKHLVNQIHEGMMVIEEYINRNYNDLFLLSGRIHTLKNLRQPFVVEKSNG